MRMLREHYKGLPCMFGEVVGRIIGESKTSGSWAVTNNGNELYSVPLFCTPHGTVIEVGRLHLETITEEGMLKLIEFEKELIDSNEEMYAGHLNAKQLKQLKKED